MLRSISIALLLCLCLGCVVQRPPSPYHVDLISPSGVVVESRNIFSVNKPRIQNEWGGQSYLIDRGSKGYKNWERDWVAPAGWYFKIEEGGER